jgi:hypothetical protein
MPAKMEGNLGKWCESRDRGRELLSTFAVRYNKFCATLSKKYGIANPASQKSQSDKGYFFATEKGVIPCHTRAL